MEGAGALEVGFDPVERVVRRENAQGDGLAVERREDLEVSAVVGRAAALDLLLERLKGGAVVSHGRRRGFPLGCFRKR